MLADLKISSLKDENEQSRRLRDFLDGCTLSDLRIFIDNVRNSKVLDAQNRGFIYQDVVNNLGKRLGFEVEFGRYRGKLDALNHDGLWFGSNLNLLVETKATSTYQIDIAKLLAYSNKVFEKYHLDHKPPILLVLFDENTENLEAQIRGSREDDWVSVIGIEALLAVASFAQSLQGGPALQAIQSSLRPRDYTRLDQLIFNMSDVVSELMTLRSVQENVSDTPGDGPLEIAMNKIIKKLERGGHKFTRKSRRSFEDHSGKIYTSYFLRKFHRKDQQYWLSIDTKDIQKMMETKSFLCLALENKAFYLSIDHRTLTNCVPLLNSFTKGNREFKHFGFSDKNQDLELLLPKARANLQLRSYISMY